jgi:hypothetical protein
VVCDDLPNGAKLSRKAAASSLARGANPVDFPRESSSRVAANAKFIFARSAAPRITSTCCSICLRPAWSLMSFLELKANSSPRIRRETTNFGWQDGYGAQRASFGGSKRDRLHQPLITRYFQIFFNTGFVRPLAKSRENESHFTAKYVSCFPTQI